MSDSNAKSKIEHPPFLGRFDMPISASGRFVLPEQWRFITASSRDVYVLPDRDEGCLRLIPGDAMRQELARAAEREHDDPELSQAIRVIGEHTCLVTVDQDGGVEIPDWQRKRAGLQQSVSLLGDFRTIRIRNPKILEKGERSLTEKEMNELSLLLR